MPPPSSSVVSEAGAAASAGAAETAGAAEAAGVAEASGVAEAAGVALRSRLKSSRTPLRRWTQCPAEKPTFLAVIRILETNSGDWGSILVRF